MTDSEIESYVRKFVGTMYHPACSCRMGPDGDPTAVLDENLRVRSIDEREVCVCVCVCLCTSK